MKQFLIPSSSLGRMASAGLLISRLFMGTAMILHGLPKIQHPTSWGDGMGIPPALQLLGALGEVGGGLGWVFGALTPLASLGVFGTMAFAILTAHRGQPFVSQGGESWDHPACYAALAVIFLTVGAGRYSVDHALATRLQAKS